MTPRQALEFLDQISGQLPTNRNVHFQIINALTTLEALVRQSDPPDPTMGTGGSFG
jgi:hypothetical protein